MNGLLNKFWWLLLLLFACTYAANAQRRLDTLRLDSIRIFPKSKLISRLVKQGVNAITRDPADTINTEATLNAQSENAYKPFEGRYIRHISITRNGFEQQVSDQAPRLEVLTTRLMNALHTNTKEWVVHNHLFIKEGDRLDAYRTADNERFLRTLNFIQDVRITIVPVDSTDTVDVKVITKDFFTLSGGLDIGSLQRVSADVSESNLLGMGQRVKFRALVHADRNPVFGYMAEYAKYSIGGSFINGYVGYSTAAPTLYDGWEEETNYYVNLDRPLVSPNTRLAGGLYYGYKTSQKAYENGRPDSMFFKYGLHAYDTWFGYNLVTGKLAESKIRDRKFVSLRYARNTFAEMPAQVTGFDPVFNDMEAVLGQITFFRQDFYKTNYVYGFGITEDVPYGYNVSLTGGWHRQLSLERPYAGIKADRYFISTGKAFYRFFFRAGAFYRSYEMEDAAMVIGFNMFSRLLQVKNVRIRQFTGLNYSGIFNRYAGDLLRINNPFGLHNFNARHITGDQRIGAVSETYMYLKYKFLGFRFAPFVTLNAVAITPALGNFTKADIYTAFGGGIRTRNENLVFGTVELRGIVFPRRIEGEAPYKILLSTNLRYRYNSNYVSKPDIIRPNVDDGL